MRIQIRMEGPAFSMFPYLWKTIVEYFIEVLLCSPGFQSIFNDTSGLFSPLAVAVADFY